MKLYKAILLSVMAIGACFAGQKKQDYPYPVDKVWTAAMRTASIKYSILSSDKDSKTMTFQ